MTTPISLDRIEAHLRGRGMHVRRDEDTVTGMWDEHRFWFYLVGKERNILQIRGRGGRTATPENRGAVMLAVNDWNRDAIFPKCYVREEAGRVACYTEVSVPMGSGVTEEQLGAQVDCGLGAGLRFLTSLSADLVSAEPDEG